MDHSRPSVHRGCPVVKERCAYVTLGQHHLVTTIRSSSYEVTCITRWDPSLNPCHSSKTNGHFCHDQHVSIKQGPVHNAALKTGAHHHQRSPCTGRRVWTETSPPARTHITKLTARLTATHHIPRGMSHEYFAVMERISSRLGSPGSFPKDVTCLNAQYSALDAQVGLTFSRTVRARNSSLMTRFITLRCMGHTCISATRAQGRIGSRRNPKRGAGRQHDTGIVVLQGLRPVGISASLTQRPGARGTRCHGCAGHRGLHSTQPTRRIATEKMPNLMPHPLGSEGYSGQPFELGEPLSGID